MEIAIATAALATLNHFLLQKFTEYIRRPRQDWLDEYYTLGEYRIEHGVIPANDTTNHTEAIKTLNHI